MIETWPGSAEPLGAHWDGSGTNFSVFSGVAERVELCLFDAEGIETRAELVEQTGDQWHAYLPGVGPGQAYGYRVHGPWDPAHGHRCNPAWRLCDTTSQPQGAVQARFMVGRTHSTHRQKLAPHAPHGASLAWNRMCQSALNLFLTGVQIHPPFGTPEVRQASMLPA